MGKWTLSEIGRAVQAQNDIEKWADVSVGGVAFNTQDLLPGMLFVPIVGNRNGHDFIKEAQIKGAVAALWSEDLADAPEGFPVLKVSNTLEALQTWASSYVAETNPKIVAITGSNGKTTTKDMTEAVLSSTYKTYKTQGNFNNDIGMPMTMLQMPRGTEVLVLEMGMSGPGEIKQLSELAQPDIAVITMIGESHIGFFGSREGIADAKMEIISGLKKTGLLIYPGAEPLLKDRTTILSDEQKKTFGWTKEWDAHPLVYESGKQETCFSSNLAPKTEICLPVPGTYNIQNALAALLVGDALGVSIEKSALKLAAFDLTENRLEWVRGINGSLLLNDAYNASPTSMKAIIRDFSTFAVEGRKRVVLGDIRELGTLSKELHRSIKEAFVPGTLEEVILYGEEMAVLYGELQGILPAEAVRYFPENQEKMIQYLQESTQSGDSILLKSSFGTNLLAVVESLKEKK